MKKIALSIFFSFSIWGAIYSQKTGTPILMSPQAYGYPTGDVANASAPAYEQKNGAEWYVFSDRDDNPTYRTAGGKEVLKTMKFLEVFLVIAQTDDYIHIVKTDKTADIEHNGKAYRLRGELPDYGWVPKANMLLWKSALVDKETRFTVKALSVNNPQTLNDVQKYADDDKMKIYNNPEQTKKSETDVRLYQFMYVFKREGNSYLIGRAPTIGLPLNVDKIVLGWVDKKIITEWKQRLVMEPNWDKAAASERKSKDIMPSIYGTPDGAKEFRATGMSTEQPLWKKDPGATRFDPNWKRLPILDTLPNGIIKTGVVSAIFDIYGNATIADEQQVQIQKEYNLVRDKFRKINMVFVIDGTEIMRDYLATIYKMIYDQMTAHSPSGDDVEQPEANKFKMGAVVYRDYSYKNCPDGDFSIKSKTLTNDFSTLKTFVSGNKVVTCSDKKEYYTNMYKGIEAALKMFDTHENETNVIVLVGSGGNRMDDNNVNRQQLVDMMVKYQVSILGFQVKNNGMDAQYNFTTELADLIKDGVDGVRKWMKGKNWIRDQDLNLKKKMFVREGTRFNLIDDSPIPGTILSADVNNPVTSDTITSVLNGIIDKMIQSKELILAGMDAKLNGIGKREVVNEGMLLFLSNMNVDVKLLQKSTLSNVQFFTEAYTSMKCDKLVNDVYKYSVFMTANELSTLTVTLDKIFDQSVEPTALRGNIQNSFKEILAEHVGADRVKKAMHSMSADQLMQMVTGLPSKSKILSKYKIDDFRDPKKVTEEDLSKLMEDIRKKTEVLQNQQANTQYFFRSNDQSWYWIPEDFLP